MNILFISDNYAKDVMGTKISIFNEMRRRGHNLIWQDKNILSNKLKEDQMFKIFSNAVKTNKVEQVWLCHSGLRLHYNLKSWLYSKGITVIGFGMSDPYYFKPQDRFPHYDIYVTNSILVFEKYGPVIPMIYNPTACDFTFHKKLDALTNHYFASIIGRGIHPRFTEKDMRLKDINFLRSKNIDVHVFGQDWKGVEAHPPVKGKKFLEVINNTTIGLDLQDTFSPLAHRMMEYSACGTPVITRRRSEVEMHFTENKDILFYDSKEELLQKLKFYRKRTHRLNSIGENAANTCKRLHDIKYRVDNIIHEVNRIMGGKEL